MSITPIRWTPEEALVEGSEKKKWDPVTSTFTPSTKAAKKAFSDLGNLQMPSMQVRSERGALSTPTFSSQTAPFQMTPWKQSCRRVEQEVLEEGMATARVLSGVLDVLGSVALLPVRAAAIGHYEDFELRS